AKELKPTLMIVPGLNSLLTANLLRRCPLDDLACQTDGLCIAFGKDHARALQRLRLRSEALGIALRATDVPNANECAAFLLGTFTCCIDCGHQLSSWIQVRTKAQDDIK